MATETLKDFYIGVLSRLCVTYSKTILVALKAAVDRNFNSHCLQDSGSSKSDGYRVKKVVNPPGKKMLNVREPHFSQCVEDPYVRGNDVIHSVMDPKVKEMKATKSSESYGCLTVEREKEF